MNLWGGGGKRSCITLPEYPVRELKDPEVVIRPGQKRYRRIATELMTKYLLSNSAQRAPNYKAMSPKSGKNASSSEKRPKKRLRHSLSVASSVGPQGRWLFKQAQQALRDWESALTRRRGERLSCVKGESWLWKEKKQRTRGHPESSCLTRNVGKDCFTTSKRLQVASAIEGFFPKKESCVFSSLQNVWSQTLPSSELHIMNRWLYRET